MIRVLIVDDDADKARAIGRLLRLVGRESHALTHVAITVLASVDALETLDPAARFDLVVSDWNIRYRNGSEVVAWAEERGLPVTVISGGFRPLWWTDGPLRRWAPEWSDGLRWLLERLPRRAELGQGHVVFGALDLEVPC